jgi:hypothetical protein
MNEYNRYIPIVIHDGEQVYYDKESDKLYLEKDYSYLVVLSSIELKILEDLKMTYSVKRGCLRFYNWIKE